MMWLDESLKAALGKPMSFKDMMSLEGETYRDVKGRQTFKIQLGNQSYFIKRHTGVGWREIVKNLLSGRLPIISARNEWKAIQRCHHLGIDTMTLVGYGEQGCNPAHKQSFVITKELVNTQSLEEYTLGWRINPPRYLHKRLLTQALARISRAFHSNGLNHRDYYLCHFLLKKGSIEQGQPQLFLIDLHRAQQRTQTPERWVIKDLAGLYFSAMHLPLTTKDRLRFVKHYSQMPLRAALTEHKKFWLRVQRQAAHLYQRGLKKGIVPGVAS